MVSGMNFGTEFLTNLYKEVVKKGGKEEDIFEVLKTGSDLIPEFAKMVVETANKGKRLSLKYLKLITNNIAVKTDSFSKDSFFKKGPVKLCFGTNFNKLILKAIPETVLVFEGFLRKTQLTKNMFDSEILAELNNSQPFTVSEFAAIICELLSRQPKGEDGQLLNKNCANIFYVKLEDGRVVAVDVYWAVCYDRKWSLDAFGLGDVWQNHGYCVFSRS